MDKALNKPLQPFKVTGDWLAQTEKLKEKYPQLTADDLKYQNGKEYELLNRLGKSLNKTREEIISILKKDGL